MRTLAKSIAKLLFCRDQLPIFYALNKNISSQVTSDLFTNFQDFQLPKRLRADSPRAIQIQVRIYKSHFTNLVFNDIFVLIYWSIF